MTGPLYHVVEEGREEEGPAGAVGDEDDDADVTMAFAAAAGTVVAAPAAVAVVAAFAVAAVLLFPKERGDGGTGEADWGSAGSSRARCYWMNETVVVAVAVAAADESGG